MGKFKEIGLTLGTLVDEKNKIYGGSFEKCEKFISLLYPDGIRPEQYSDMLCLCRIFDKMMRVATAKDALGESPFADIAGYGILGVAPKLDTDEKRVAFLASALGCAIEVRQEVKENQIDAFGTLDE